MGGEESQYSEYQISEEEQELLNNLPVDAKRVVYDPRPPQPPPNWTSDRVRYACSLDWEGIPEDIKSKYEDELDVLSLFVEVVPRFENNIESENHEDPSNKNNATSETEEETDHLNGQGQLDENYLCRARQLLQCGSWLSEVTGIILKEDQLRRSNENSKKLPYIFLFKSANGERYFILPMIPELKYIRRVDESQIEQIEQIEQNEHSEEENSNGSNIRIQRIWLEGRIRIFLEITKDINKDEEIIMDRDNHEDAVIDVTQIPVASPNDKFFEKIDFLLSSMVLQEPNDPSRSFVIPKNVMCSRLQSKEDQKFFSTLQSLESLVQIQLIKEESHPCNGQFGLFAMSNIPKSSYIAEYTGQVVMHEPDNLQGKERLYASKYLVDFTNPFGGEEGQPINEIWVDADIVGNEIRFINDGAGTGKYANVHFKRAWIGGKMHVIVQTLRDIKRGDELLTEYGDRYWGNMPSESNEEIQEGLDPEMQISQEEVDIQTTDDDQQL